MTLEYIITSAVSALNNHVQSIHGNAACISLRVLAGWGSSAFVCCVQASRRKIDFFLRSWIVLIFYFLIMSGWTGLRWGSGCILTSLLVTAGIDSYTPTLLIWEKMDGWAVLSGFSSIISPLNGVLHHKLTVWPNHSDGWRHWRGCACARACVWF